MRAVIYARYSSENQRDASIEDQLRVCQARVDREGWHVAATFVDHAASGATSLRPGYQAMLAAFRAGGIDVVIAESLDRFSRDLEHIASFHKQATFHSVQIHTLAEGDISELHVGLKGTMGALYLKDLADKTRRGLEGRIHAGRSVGMPPYGYVVVRQLDDAGELDRGLRAICPDRAAVVRRIFENYAGGISPQRIARTLNSDGIAGPAGGLWYEASIRGRPKRQDGILRNETYVGRIVWRRRINIKDPVSGAKLRRDAKPEHLVHADAPHLRIVDDVLWDRVQERLVAEAAPVTIGRINAGHKFWDRRRPRHVLSQKVFCGVCGRAFMPTGKDYLGCQAAKNGGCVNVRTIRRTSLEALAMELLHCQLMQPGMLAEFMGGFSDAWADLAGELHTKAEAGRRERAALDRKVANLVEAISDGRSSAAILAKLATLEKAKANLADALDVVTARAPQPYDPAMAEAYSRRIADLTAMLRDGDDPEGLELARALIDRVIVHPGPVGADPPTIELVGDLMALLDTAGLAGASTSEDGPDPVLALFVSSVKEAPRAEPLAFFQNSLSAREPNTLKRVLVTIAWFYGEFRASPRLGRRFLCRAGRCQEQSVAHQKTTKGGSGCFASTGSTDPPWSKPK